MCPTRPGQTIPYDALWKRAILYSRFGKLVTENREANGDLLQVLPRLYGYTGDRQYLEYARRIADNFLADPEFTPPALDDHSCEYISGLGLLQGVLSTADPEAEKIYRPRIKALLDKILERGQNSDGMLTAWFPATPGPHDDYALSNNWGYNYVAFLDYDMATGGSIYREAVRKPLGNLGKPLYHQRKWKRDNIDGPADSIEGGLYVLAYEPVETGIRWTDIEVRDDLLPRLTDGINKFYCNAARTIILYALSKTQNIHTLKWRADLRLGAARDGAGVKVFVAARDPWDGPLIFDIPRHRDWLHLSRDWPRINYLPEYFTVELGKEYKVQVGDAAPQTMKGAELRKGLPIHLATGQGLLISVAPAR